MNAQTQIFTAEELKALYDFRAAWPLARCRKVNARNWEEVLYMAWSNDWEEQRGTLRVLRNSPRFESMADIVAKFKAIPQDFHYYGCTGLNWATAPTRAEVLAKLAKAAGADQIKRQKRAGRAGMYCCTYRVGAPQSQPYDIESYMPRGVPLSERTEAYIVNVRGETVKGDLS